MRRRICGGGGWGKWIEDGGRRGSGAPMRQKPSIPFTAVVVVVVAVVVVVVVAVVVVAGSKVTIIAEKRVIEYIF